VNEAVSALNSQNLSYHILIAKDGTPFQTRPFTQSAAHPGLSNWKATGAVDLGGSVMKDSVGICLMNMGFAVNGLPPASVGQGKLIYNADDPTMQSWERYSPAQIATCKNIVEDLVAIYPIREVVGHHDVAIMGKFDPGPLFDLAALNELIRVPKPLGFPTTVDSADGFLNLRSGPSARAAVLRQLPNGTSLHIRSIAYGNKAQCIDPNTTQNRKRFLTPWASVDITGANKHAGFVHMGGLAETPLVRGLERRL
jgi:N-acetylmuramoyl-L-alanine amidase